MLVMRHTISLLLLPLLTIAYPTKMEASIDPIERNNKNDMLDLTRFKRHGSFDFAGQIKKGVVSTIGKASASSAGGSSGHSSQGHSAPHYEEEHFDGWQLKKSILNTLFQAVKAITGGITAINGKLIKGSGYAISAGGQLVAATGEKVTGVGKNIALSAKLIPPSGGHGGSGNKDHFAKLAGASSHSSHGSANAGSASGHSTPQHSEGFTSFDHPIDVHSGYGTEPDHLALTHAAHGEQHFGAAGHSGGGSVAGGHGGGLYLPVAFDSSYHGTENHGYVEPILNSYGTSANGHSHFLNIDHTASKSKDTMKYIEYKEQSNKVPSKSESLQNAANAIRNILKKLPDTFTHNGVTHTAPHKQEENTKVIHQYVIPPDPFSSIPHFEPITPDSNHNPTSLSPQSASEFQQYYSIPLAAPINSVTHIQTITTAYGAPITDFQKPTPIVDVNNWITRPVGPGYIDYSIKSEPIDIYHTMTLKHGTSNNIPYKTLLPTQKLTLQHLQQTPKRQQLNSNVYVQNNSNQFHQQHLNDIQQTLGPINYEVQKSLGFEIQLLDPK